MSGLGAPALCIFNRPNTIQNMFNTFYEDILNHPKMKEMEHKVIIYPKNKDIWNFNIELIRPLGCVHKIYGMSISYPYSLLGKECDEDFPSTIKIELLGLNLLNSNEAEIINTPHVSYFPRNDMNDLIEYIFRISNNFSNPCIKNQENCLFLNTQDI